MWLLHPLQDILSSPAKVAVLRVLCDANSPLSGRETVRRAEVSYGPGWAALQDLVRSGVLVKRDLGRASAYELREPEGALIQAVRHLFATERERSQQITDVLASEVPEALSIVLYGSEARSEAGAGSDTDILIVVEEKTEDLEDRVDRACLALAGQHSLALSWHIADLADLRQWEETGSDFWRNIVRDGIRLAGESLEGLRSRWQTGRAS
jgi:predicted nucleotidyltransferase